MKASELINQLKSIMDVHGDLEILGGYVSDDSGLDRAVTVDAEGVASNRNPIGIFLES